MDLTVTNETEGQTHTAGFVRQNKRITSATEDELIDFWIKAADQYIETETNRTLFEKSYTLRFQRIYPEVALPRPPLVTVDAIRITPEDEAEEALDISSLKTFTKEMLVHVCVPDIEVSAAGVLEIDFTAGHGTADEIPFALRQATLLLASHWFTSREAAYMDPRLMMVEKKIPFGVDDIIRKYRIPNVTSEIE